jgi:MoaA/NifB/PqqE/SkfB family radical SAM enzyme
MIDNIFWDRIEERANETIAALKRGQVPDVIRFAIHLTNRCNMRCVYYHEVKGNQVMDRKLFQSLCERAGRNGIIHITGGEPTCVKWLDDEIYKQRGKVKMALNTNLLHLPKRKALESLFRIKTSLDDFDSTRWNETVGGNYFNKVVSNIKEATKYVQHVSVSYTATHQNAHRFSGFIEFCQDNFPNLYSVSASFFKGDGGMALTKNDVDILFVASEKLDPVSKHIFDTTHNRNGNYFPQNIGIPCYLSMTERLYDEYGQEFYCSHLFRDHVRPPGKPGEDPHCVTGCNDKFHKFNQMIHRKITARRCSQENKE